MKNFFTLAILTLLLALFASSAFAQVSPLDSVILESKVVDTSLVGATGSPAFMMRVFITNEDSLTFLTLALRESTINGSAYALLARTGTGSLTFSSVVSPLDPNTLKWFGSASFSQYNDNSPDRFLVAAGFDGSDPATIEPPNLARKGIWDIKFRHTSFGIDSMGVIRFDSSRVSGLPCLFTNTVPADKVPNFVPSLITVVRTDVRDVNPGQRPQSYSLSQNYPNPFNANTQIAFALPKAGKTTLEIFNILGQKVNTLLDEYMEAGNKIVNWDGRDVSGREVPSGIYFYRLRSENFLQTKKMLMIQ